MTLLKRVEGTTLSTKLIAAMVSLVLLTATAVVVFSYHRFEGAMVQRALDRLEVHASLLAVGIEDQVRNAGADIIGFRSAASLDGIIRARLNGGRHPVDGSSEAVWRRRMALRYVAELESKPAYRQFAIIGLDDGGRELVRVERSNPDGPIRIVPDDQLQRKGDRDFFQETVRLPAREVSVSTIDEALSVTEGTRAPILRIATPIHVADGKPFGVLKVTIDLGEVLAALHAFSGFGGNIYVTNAQGVYLVHPDSRGKIDLELGTAGGVAGEFPDLATALDASQPKSLVLTNRAGERLGVAVAPVRLAEGRHLSVIETEPYAAIVAPAVAVRDASVAFGLAVVLAAVLLAVLLSRSLARPLVEMTGAVQAFAGGGPAAVPVSGGGEVGFLARAFNRMASEIHDSEAKLQENAERARICAAVVEQGRVPIITATLDGTITTWNASAERLYQYTAAEAIGSSVNIIIPPERRQEFQAAITEAYKEGPIEAIDTVRMAKDGRRIEVSLFVSPLRSSSGEIVGLAAITRDITKEKFVEEKFRLAVESSPSGMVLIDPGGKIILVNGEVERLFGYRRDELIGQPVEILVPERLRDGHRRERDVFRVHPEARRIANREVFGRCKDGTEIPIEVGLNPIPTRDGLLVLSVIVDITERRHAQEMFRLAVEASPSAMVMLDRSRVLMMVNTEVERLFGYRREELVGKPVDIIVPERYRPECRQLLEDFMADPKARRIGGGRDLFGQRKDGSEFPVEVGLNPIRLGDEVLILSVIVDISERERAERLKDEFVSTVSHELRTPLTSIAASLGLLAGSADANLPPAAKRLITIAQSNSQRLVRLINDILDIEKIESGEVVFDLRPVEVRSLVDQAIEVNRALADSYGVRLRLEKSPDCEVYADPDRLTQVVTNLLSNAIKYSPRDAEVVVAIEQRGDRIRMSVRDHGPGIPQSFRSRIFEKFAQADAADGRQKGGTGLGLSIVKQIVQRLGGEVGFADAPGGGTAFFVELPRLAPAVRGDVQHGGKFVGTPILLCEDDADAAAMMRDQLGEAGFATDVAPTAAAALARAATTTYAAFLVDLQLADGDGINLIQQLRARPQSSATPIVVVSANPDRGRADPRSRGLNVLDWMGKPLDIERLLQALRPAHTGNGAERLRILHIDDDPDVLGMVAHALDDDANVVSVRTVEQARSAIAADHFDLAVVDLSLDGSSGFDLIPELCDAAGHTIPVVIYSALASSAVQPAQVQAVLPKSRTSIDRLITNLRKRLAERTEHAA
jgi:PAS domain S-box-containing protein